MVDDDWVKKYKVYRMIVNQTHDGWWAILFSNYSSKQFKFEAPGLTVDEALINAFEEMYKTFKENKHE